MTRFYFDFRQGQELAPDTIGGEFADVEKAYLEAFKAAQEMWGELLSRRRDPRRCAFEVHDGNGNNLFVLPFLELLESCQDRIPLEKSTEETVRQTIDAVTLVRHR